MIDNQRASVVEFFRAQADSATASATEHAHQSAQQPQHVPVPQVLLQQIRIMQTEEYQKTLKALHQQYQKQVLARQRKEQRTNEAREYWSWFELSGERSLRDEERRKRRWERRHQRPYSTTMDKRFYPSSSIYYRGEEAVLPQTDGLPAARDAMIRRIKNLLLPHGDATTDGYEEKVEGLARSIEKKLKAPDRGDTLLAEYEDLSTLMDRLRAASKATFGGCVLPAFKGPVVNNNN